MMDNRLHTISIKFVFIAGFPEEIDDDNIIVDDDKVKQNSKLTQSIYTVCHVSFLICSKCKVLSAQAKTVTKKPYDN